MGVSTSSSRLLPWLRRALVAGAIFFVAYLAVAWALSRALDPREMAGWLEPRLESALGRGVEVGRVEVGILPLGVRLQELAVSDPTGMAPELVRVGSVELRVAILPLLRREVEVTRLTVDGLRADLRVGTDGLGNFAAPGEMATGGEPVPDSSAAPANEASTLEPASERAGPPGETAPPRPESSERPFALNLRSVRVSGADVRFARAADTLVVEGSDLRLRAGVRKAAHGPWTLVGRSDGKVTLRVGGSPPLLDAVALGLSFDVEADSSFAGLRVRTGELQLGGIALALAGQAHDLQGPVRRVALTLKGEGLAVRDLLAALPDSLRRRVAVEAEGSLAADLSVTGEVGPGRLPEVAGVASLARGRVTLRGSPLAEGVEAEMTLRPDRTVLARVRGTALGGPLLLEGGATLGNAPVVDLAVTADPDLGRLASVVALPEGVTAGGRLDTRLTVAGPLGSPRALRLEGEIHPRALRLTHPALGVPVTVEEALLRVEENRMAFRDLPLALGEDRLVVSGQLDDFLAFLDPGAIPRLQGEVEGARLDLTKLSTRPLPDSSLTYGKVAFAKVGNRTVGAFSVEEAARALGLARPDSLPLGGAVLVALDTVIDRQGRMENLRARVEFGPRFLRVAEASLQRYGGEIRTVAQLSLGADPATPFSLSLQVRELDAGAFLSETTPLGRFVRGTLTLELELAGTLDGHLLPERPALVGWGRFALAGGGLASVPLTRALATFLGREDLREPTIRDWRSSFVLANGMLRLGEGRLEGAPGSPTVAGSVGLDGALDLLSIFDLPSQGLDASALERLGVAGEIAADVAWRPEVVQAVLRIGGSVVSPQVQADPAAAARTLAQAVQEEVRGEIQERLDAHKAAAQQVIQEQQAEAQRVLEERKQEVRQEAQQRAAGFLRGLLRGRDPARPDSVRPDTIRPDSLRPDTTPPDTTRPDTVRPDTVRPDTAGRPDSLRRPDTLTGPRGSGPPTRRLLTEALPAIRVGLSPSPCPFWEAGCCAAVRRPGPRGLPGPPARTTG